MGHTSFLLWKFRLTNMYWRSLNLLLLRVHSSFWSCHFCVLVVKDLELSAFLQTSIPFIRGCRKMAYQQGHLMPSANHCHLKRKPRFDRLF